MSRYNKRLAAGIAQEEQTAARSISLREQFEKKKENIVYVEGLPEKIYRICIGIISAVFMLIGIIGLLIPEVREQLIRILIQFVGDVTGLVGL